MFGEREAPESVGFLSDKWNTSQPNLIVLIVYNEKRPWVQTDCNSASSSVYPWSSALPPPSNAKHTLQYHVMVKQVCLTEKGEYFPAEVVSNFHSGLIMACGNKLTEREKSFLWSLFVSLISPSWFPKLRYMSESFIRSSEASTSTILME